MMLGSILNPINSSIIAVALVPIAVAFGAPASETAWLVAALYLATSIGQPLFGRLVDIFGPRPLYLIGAVLTGIAGLLGTFAPGLWMLIVARVVLGFGTCAAYPASMYLIRSEEKRTGVSSPAGVLTALSVTTQTIAVVGPTLGGLLIGIGGWRAVFAINIPLSVACLILGLLVLPRRARAARTDTDARFDVVGVILFSGMMISVLVLLMDFRIDRLWLVAVAVVAAGAFAIRELRARDPFIDVRVLGGNVPLVVTYLRSVLGATVTYAFLYGFTQWLEGGRGLSASQAGLVLMPAFATGIVVAVVTGRRPQIRGKLLVGASTMVVACVLMLFVHETSAVWFLVVIAVIVGVPQGLINLAIQNTLYHQADPERMGASSGLLRTFMYLGAMLASSASGAFFGAQATDGGLHELAAFMLIAAVLLVLITVLDRSLIKVDRAAGEGQRAKVSSDR
ncbi:MFS transporter [Streptomyces sp. SID6673]|uniref:MFS transporter n=2 Tax=Gordonia hankookensis TaxID=589403 RepID=A0ABR7WH46_9ACTN|nr:MFS transporter [Gordonia hankookensis]NDZ97022.1 MFS transporter [Streptomyces sp. SID11726]NEB26210.1 MFS transporter [Streptomyces sp. SID6673]